MGKYLIDTNVVPDYFSASYPTAGMTGNVPPSE